ncbi:MAG: hypothetical protein KA792_01675 [Bacteroidales bacterium]|nr:hypothetical protein [Bacteroidales bacterium]
MKFLKFFITVLIIIVFNSCSRINLFTESRYDYLNKVAVNTKKDTVKLNEILTITKENEYRKDSIAGENAVINSNDKKNNSLKARENLKEVLTKAGNNFKHSNLAENKSQTYKNSSELIQKKQAKIMKKIGDKLGIINPDAQELLLWLLVILLAILILVLLKPLIITLFIIVLIAILILAAIHFLL